MPDVHLYCDYWASVLRMRGIVHDEVQRRGLVDLDIFRSCLNRPETRLPRFGYYILMLFLGPVLIPYRMIQRIASRLHVPLAGEDEAGELLAPYRLQLERQASGQVNVRWKGERLAHDLIDPERPDVVFSVVYPAYKILVAALLAMGLALLLHWTSGREGLSEWLRPVLLFANFPLLAGILYLIFRDWLTALVAPLPVFVVLWVVSLLGPVREMPLGTLAAALAGLAVAYFVVDAFMIPRGMAPTLYLYKNEPRSPVFPYAEGQAPYWLDGRTYWVWRFVSLTPAEMHKFWERDWERVEAWVRADGENAGQIEWVVVDLHFRELWIPYDRFVSDARAAGHRHVLEELRRDTRRDAAWVIEVDTNFVGHAPELRGVFMLPLRHGWRRARIRQLARSLRIQVEHDHPRDYRDAVRRLRLAGLDFIDDIPEHLRWYALRQLLAIPWRYWRYPRGANAAARPYLYAQPNHAAPLQSCEPCMQFKAAGSAAGERSAPDVPAPSITHSDV
ncbi:MAG: hypothetical protein ACE5G2_03450 [Candidatus Krumholzibacteriia bacterium]